MKKCLLIGFAAAIALCSSAFAGQYYSDGYGRGYTPAPYSRYPGRPSYDEECDPVNQIFASFMYRSVRLKKEKAGSPSNVKYTPGHFAVGYIHSMQKLQVGAAFNYEGGTRKLRNRDGSSLKIKNSIPGISGFATYRPFPDSTYVSGSMFLGFASYKAKDLRTPFAVGGSDKDHRNLFSLGFEAGHTWSFGPGLLVTPHIGFDYSYAPSEKFNVSGVPIGIKSQSYFEFPLGVTLKKTFNCGGWLLTPKVDLAITPSVGGIDPKNAHPGFAYRVADKWKVVGASGSNFGGRITLGVDAKLGQRVALGLDYTYEGRSKYNDHRIAASFNLAF